MVRARAIPPLNGLTPIWPMARRIFNVADTFTIRSRGVVLMPGLVPINDERFRVGDPLLLRRPDGSEFCTWIGRPR